MNMREAFALLDKGRKVKLLGWVGCWLEGTSCDPILVSMSDRHGHHFWPTVQEINSQEWREAPYEPEGL